MGKSERVIGICAGVAFADVIAIAKAVANEFVIARPAFARTHGGFGAWTRRRGWWESRVCLMSEEDAESAGVGAASWKDKGKSAQVEVCAA